MSAKVLGNLKMGLVFIISAPAGTGKTTLVSMLTKEFSCIKESISFTTRQPRVGESEGDHYHFVSQEQFDELQNQGRLLEHVSLFGQSYGTSKDELEKELKYGHHVVLVIDTQGALKLKKEGFEACYIFISPPSMEVLEQRLKNRNKDSSKSIEVRLSTAQHEMQQARFYDYHLVNENLQDSYEILKSIIICQEHKVLTQAKKEGLLR